MTHKKNFPVFDCDAHINDPLDIWDYVEPEYRDLVKRSYWKDNKHTVLNGRTEVIGGENYDFPTYNPICIAGPGFNKKIIRKLGQMPLTPEQIDYVEHKGAMKPEARAKEMDLMGIDQVLVIPTMTVAHLPFVENIDGASAFCRAYNNWAIDWCKKVPGRLYAAASLPVQSPAAAAEEIRRTAKLGIKVGLIRPIDARGNYPNRLIRTADAASVATYDLVFRTFQETGMVLGIHAFPTPPSEPSATVVTPGEFIMRAGEGAVRPPDTQTMSFIYEGMTWLAQVFLSGLLDRYPKLKMAIFECNATWLPALLDHCDRLFKLYKRERLFPAKRLPSEAFEEQCVISFESDETPVFRQWDRFQKTGIWASDAYHHDAADAWSALKEMDDVGVPVEVQKRLMGENACRMYGIEQKLFVREAPSVLERPTWFPKEKDLSIWWEKEAYPRGRQQAVKP